MKKSISILLATFFMITAFAVTAEAKLPNTWAEFKAEYQTAGKTPKGAVTMLFKAIYCYMKSVENKDGTLRADASKMLRYTLYSTNSIEASPYYRTFYERLLDKEDHYIFRSYCAGTTVDNSYAMNPDDFTIMIDKVREEKDDYVRVFIKSSGADSVRPVGVQKKPDGLWYTVNINSVYVQVRHTKSYVEQHMHDHDPDFD